MVAQISAVCSNVQDAYVMADDDVVDRLVFPRGWLVEIRPCVKCAAFAAIGDAVTRLAEKIKFRNGIGIEIAEQNGIFLVVHDADQLFKFRFSVNEEIRLYGR